MDMSDFFVISAPYGVHVDCLPYVETDPGTRVRPVGWRFLCDFHGNRENSQISNLIFRIHTHIHPVLLLPRDTVLYIPV